MTTEVQKARNDDGGDVASSTNVSHSYARPPVDIAENESGFTLFADLPGVSKQDLTIRVDGDTLVIEGVLNAPTPERMDLIYGEAQFSAYRRQFTLSRELDCSKIEANLNNGVLKLTIPKTEEAKPRRINVALS
jgi:HSP20 family protein